MLITAPTAPIRGTWTTFFFVYIIPKSRRDKYLWGFRTPDQVREPQRMSTATDFQLDENTPFLSDTVRTPWENLKHRYKNTRKYIISKGALAILMWIFTASTLYSFVFNHMFAYNTSITYTIGYVYQTIVFCFYPIAGYLADNKYGRYKTVVFGLWLLLPSFIFLAIEVSSPLLFRFQKYIGIITTIATIISFILLAISTVSFKANVIQLGMDQLYDFPVEDQSLFIHWLVWVWYLIIFLVQLSLKMQLFQTSVILYCDVANTTTNYSNIIYSGCGLFGLLILVFVVLLVVSLCIAHCKKHWFLIEPSRVNPYKLVYQITKFAWNHKVPVKRSAFTYCEDDLPSGLNLAKDKYGGPFTTEQVEDVKVFYGILKILFSLGPVFFINFAADVMLYPFARHGSILKIYHSNFSHFTLYNRPVQLLLIHGGLLTPLVTTICIPLYLFLLRPFLFNYIPGMLKRMGLGATMTVLSLMCTVAIGAWAHTRYKVGCMFDSDSAIVTMNDTVLNVGPFYHSSLLAIQRVLVSFSNMLIYIALYEFICSQSPYSMKGLLIGLSFAIKGLFQVIAAVLALPFALAVDNTHISCGVSYYVMNAGVGVVSVLVYVWVAKKYKYRERDEPSNIYMYAENYYSRGPPEE